MLKDKAVYERLSGFVNRLKEADVKIHLVGDYKALHEAVHNVQLQVFYPLISVRQNFNKPGMVPQLNAYRIHFHGERGKIKKVFTKGRLILDDFSWITDDLENVGRLLDGVWTDPTLVGLDELINCLDQLIQVQPAVINSNLIRSVRELDLSKLQLTLQEIYGDLRDQRVNERQLYLFKKGIDDLVKLDNELNRLIREHKEWQKVDNHLNLIESVRYKSREEAEMIWFIVNKTVDALCNETIDEAWSEKLKSLGQLINDAIRSFDDTSSTALFPGYNAECRLRFHTVDGNLKTLCEQLRPIGDSVHDVLTVLE